MKTAQEIIADKYSELIHKWTTQDRISTFTRAERAIWLLVSIRCEIDMEGFVSVFDQAVSRSELVEAIGYLREIDLGEIAKLFEQALAILNANNFYTQDGNPATGCYWLPEEAQAALDAIGKEIQKEQVLWDIDARLLDMLNAETT